MQTRHGGRNLTRVDQTDKQDHLGIGGWTMLLASPLKSYHA